MARPRVPLLSRRKALEAALAIIDNDGIAALSIRRLADRLNVNGASLYHHFQNKEEIIIGAAQIALEGIRPPLDGDEPWRIWVLRNARQLRQTLRDHPDFLEVVLRVYPRGIDGELADATVTLLQKGNVPTGAIIPMLEALTLYAVSNALHEHQRCGDDLKSSTPDPSPFPHLLSALELRAISADEVFDMVCEKIIDSTIMKTLERGGTTPRSASAPPGTESPQFTENWATV